MLLPKKTKYRKVRKGRNNGKATRGNYIAFGDYALQSQSNSDVTSRQIESARQAMTRYIKRGGKIWIRIFPHIPVTRKPVGLKMGMGKGNPESADAIIARNTNVFVADTLSTQNKNQCDELQDEGSIFVRNIINFLISVSA